MNLSELGPQGPDWLRAFVRGFYFYFTDQYALRYYTSDNRIAYHYIADATPDRWYDLYALQSYIDQGNGGSRDAADHPEIIEILP